MNSAIRQVISIADNDLTIIEYQGERVVTLAMVDQVHQRPEGTARKRFNDKRFGKAIPRDACTKTEPFTVDCPARALSAGYSNVLQSRVFLVDLIIKP